MANDLLEGASCYMLDDFLKGESSGFICETQSYFSWFVDHSRLILGSAMCCLFFPTVPRIPAKRLVALPFKNIGTKYHDWSCLLPEKPFFNGLFFFFFSLIEEKKAILKKIQTRVRNLVGKQMLLEHLEGLLTYYRESLMVMRVLHCHELQVLSMQNNYDEVKVATAKKVHS